MWCVGAHKRRKNFFWSERIFFDICVLFQCIEYTFRIYIVLHIKKHYIEFLLVFKIFESLQCAHNSTQIGWQILFVVIILERQFVKNESFSNLVCGIKKLICDSRTLNSNSGLKMSYKIKDINIKNHIYYFSDDIINIKFFWSK